MPNMPAKVYRKHCAEILERVARGQDTRPATDAEVLFGFCEVSLQVPLTQDASAAYVQLFTGSMGFNPAPEVAMSERFPGAANQTIAELRRKLSQKWRVADDPKQLLLEAA
jgi:hypothetical protein